MTMAPTTHDLATGSSASFISGYPVVGQDFDEYMDDFDHHFDDAVVEALAYARKDFHRAAMMKDEWRDYAEFLDVEFDGQDFCYVVTDPGKFDEIMELEYGTMERAPVALIRPMAMTQPIVLAQIMSAHLMGTVPSA